MKYISIYISSTYRYVFHSKPSPWLSGNSKMNYHNPYFCILSKLYIEKKKLQVEDQVQGGGFIQPNQKVN